MPTVVHGGGISIVKTNLTPGAGVSNDGDDQVIAGENIGTGEPENLTVTAERRLRVETAPSIESVNLFASPSPWTGSPWSAKTAW